ncbi:MAG TPA: dihydropteroate synthase [Vicinamibacterales bacterium]|nr:dihydropteroate synthase [Vicinamibacterales bacterium]
MRRRFTLRLPGGAAWTLGERTLVMGIVNVTPDSFSDGGVHLDVKAAVASALRMVEEGADVLDIGGESTRPGAQPVAEGEERRRVLPVIEALAGRVTVPISIDTYKAAVADAALAAGASIVNDISGLRYDPELAGVVARRGAPIVLMHTRGRSRDMYEQANYHDVVDEVLDELRESVAFAAGAGVPREQTLVDPGIGFAKDATHSFEVLGRLTEFADLGRPIVVGSSRKSFLNRPIKQGALAADGEWPTAASVAAAALAGMHIVRVHAVREMAQVVRVADEIQKYHRDR